MNSKCVHWLLPLLVVAGFLVLIFHSVPAQQAVQAQTLRHLAWVLPLVIKLVFLD